MAKNRKPQSAAVRFGPAVNAFLLCLLVGGSGVGYVWQRKKIDMLGERVAYWEKALAEQQRQRQTLLRKHTFLTSPAELEARVKRMNLDLAPTSPDRIVRIDVNAAPEKPKPDRSSIDQIAKISPGRAP